MTAYIANHQKKLNILHKRERELIHALKNSYAPIKIEKIAQKLATAKLALYKAKIAQVSERPPMSHMAELEELAINTESLTAIIKKYKKSIAEIES